MRGTLFLLVLGGIGCGASPAPEPPKDATAAVQPVAQVPKPQAVAESAPGKDGAPVRVEATLGEAAARVELTFLRAGRDVRVELTGTDGLTILGDPLPIQGGSFAAGQAVGFDVAFTRSQPHSNLAVLVSGDFGAGRRLRAASFTVGERTKVRAQSEGMVDAQGNRIKIAGQAQQQ